jgi:hypothetical protein
MKFPNIKALLLAAAKNLFSSKPAKGPIAASPPTETVPDTSSLPKLSEHDMQRIVDVLLRLKDILNNNNVSGDASSPVTIDTFLAYGVDRNIATNFGDGALTLGLALDTNSGQPKKLITPMGAIHLVESGFTDQRGIGAARKQIKAEFGALYTTSSASASAGADAQLMVLGKDADGEPLADIPGTKLVPGFRQFDTTLDKNTLGILRHEAAQTQAAHVASNLVQPIEHLISTYRFTGNLPDAALLFALENTVGRESVSGPSANYLRQTLELK